MTDQVEDLAVYNELQESLLEKFIEAGGNLNVYQTGRGEGYSTFAIVQCLQQALTTDRNVIYVYDDKGWTASQFRRVAYEFFGISAVVVQDQNKVIIGTKTIRLVKPDNHSNKVRGLRYDDVFGDVAFKTIDQNEDFFYVLSMCQKPQRGDGTGLRLMIIR